MPEPFGSFGWICRHTPLPQCNLMFQQLWNKGSSNGTSNANYATLFPPTSDFFARYNVSQTSGPDDANVVLARLQAGAGLGAACEIPRVGQRGSVGDVVLVVMSFLSILLCGGLIFHSRRRKAAVGRLEMSIFLGGFALFSALQAVTMTSMLEMGSQALTILSALECAVIAGLCWLLLGNALVATQLVEDGSISSLAPTIGLAVVTFGGTLYIALATGFGWEKPFIIATNTDLKSIPLFVLTLIWPAIAIFAYVIAMVFVIFDLDELNPAILLGGATIVFAGGQVVMFLANQPLCTVAKGKVNAAFITSITNNAAVLILVFMWNLITEGDWFDEAFY